MASLLESERRKLSLVGHPDSPLVRNTVNGDWPRLTIADMAAIDASAAGLIKGLNRFHRMLMSKYMLAFTAYTRRPLRCVVPECPPSDCACPCDCQAEPEPECQCDRPLDDAPCPCGYVKEDDPCQSQELPCRPEYCQARRN
ncbi:MAG: hypothetical protein LBS11_06620 [Oscillospiraceae bacterium]|nr:hypothetical protein [Oscillospiraceae bacterium]